MVSLPDTGEGLGVGGDIEAVFDQVGFKPNSQFQRDILNAPHRFIEVTGGEQGGKSLIGTKVLLKRWIEDMANNPLDGTGSSPPILYWLIGDAYSETEREFGYISDDLRALGLPVVDTKRVDPGKIEVKFPDERQPRLRIETKSGRDVRKLSRDAPHGIIVCEAGQCDIVVFERAQGRVTPKGGWLLLVGTMESSVGWFPAISAQWASGVDDRKSFRLPSYANIALYPGGREDPKILDLKRNSSDEFFMERIEGIAVPPKGLVFPEFRPDVHVQQCEQIVGEPVYIWEDPGYSGSYHALEIANVIDGQVRIFDEIYMKGLITEEIVDIAMGREWWKEPAKYGVADIAATQHQSMPAVVAVWMQKAGLYMHTKKVGIPEGIERMKSFLKIDPVTHGPKIIVSPVCRGLISEFGAAPNPDDGQLRAYRWGTDREGNVVGTKPKDQFNDAIKAVTYGLVDRFGYAYSADRKKIRVKRW
jgi:hypothetical protein